MGGNIRDFSAIQPCFGLQIDIYSPVSGCAECAEGRKHGRFGGLLLGTVERDEGRADSGGLAEDNAVKRRVMPAAPGRPRGRCQPVDHAGLILEQYPECGVIWVGKVRSLWVGLIYRGPSAA